MRKTGVKCFSILKIPVSIVSKVQKGYTFFVARVYRNHDKVHWNHIKYNSVQEAMDAPDGLAVLGIIMVENTRRANFR